MMTKDQANAIADGLVTQQRAEALRVKNVAGLRVSFLYQCPELRLLEPQQRLDVVREAGRSFRGHWGVIASLIVWIVAFGAFCSVLAPAGIRSTFHLWWLAMLVFPPFVLHLSLVRLHVRYLARLRHLSS